jgi:hypothetical protein
MSRLSQMKSLWCYYTLSTFEFAEDIMSAILEELEIQALQLSPPERSKLIHRLIVSLDGEPEESPEAIAQA